MIRIKASYTGRLLGNLSAYLASFQQNVNAITADVVQEVAPDALDELGYVPAKHDPNQKIDWTTVIQGVAFHASDGFGGGIPHSRTNALPDGWIFTTDGNGHVLIANPVPGAPFLYGSLSKSNPGKYQQAFLAAIGWQTAAPTVYFWLEAVTEEVVKRIDAQFGDMGSVNSSTRAYTRL